MSLSRWGVTVWRYILEWRRSVDRSDPTFDKIPSPPITHYHTAPPISHPTHTGNTQALNPFLSSHNEFPTMEPIHLPTDALAEVFKFLYRSERTQLASVSSQAADAILPGLKAEHRKVSPNAYTTIQTYH